MFKKVWIIFSLVFAGAFQLRGQEMLWVVVNNGTALYLSPLEFEWIPIINKEKVPAKTFILTKDSTDCQVFKNTDAHELPPDAYFFLADIFPRDRNEIVSALTQIEAEQLPNPKKDQDEKRILGLIYGRQVSAAQIESRVPFEKARQNAINWFVASENHSAALLSLKRMLCKFPNTYLNPEYTNLLLKLYDRLELYGFLIEESRFLLNIQEKEFHLMVKSWYEIAQKKLQDNHKKR